MYPTLQDTIRNIEIDIAYYERELKVRFLFRKKVGISFLMDKIEDLNIARERLVNLRNKVKLYEIYTTI